MIGAILLALAQATPPLVAPPVIVKPPSGPVSAALRTLGDGFQAVGHCSRSMPAEQLDRFLRLAAANPIEQPYLIMRFGQGSRSPHDGVWCDRRFARMRQEAEARTPK